MTATALWAAVVASYEPNGLITLTNIRNPAANAIDTAIGENAAQGVIDLWGSCAQEDYDADSALHVEVAKQGVIALLWRRGGSSASIAEVKWNEVFGADGLIAKVRKTGPRGHQGPTSSSGSIASSEYDQGHAVLPWSDPAALPGGIVPRRRRWSGE